MINFVYHKLKLIFGIGIGLIVFQKLFSVQNTEDTPRILGEDRLSLENIETAQKMANLSARTEAFWGALIADALSMPVHWFYDPSDIKRTYGHWIKDYEAPKEKHPSCILHLSNPSGSGRGGGDAKPVVGRIILQDKLKYWTDGRSTHYHQGMQPGENTLNSISSLTVAKSLRDVDPEQKSENWDQQAEKVFEDYVALLTTPKSHNDTYAESFHRAFFAEWEKAGGPKMGKEILKFATERKQGIFNSKAEDHQLEVVGSLVMSIPWILHYSNQPEDKCKSATWNFVSLTHPVHTLKPYVDLYSGALHKVVNGADLEEVANEALSSQILGGEKSAQFVKFAKEALRQEQTDKDKLTVLQETADRMGIPCYIQGALIIVFFLASEYANNFEAGVLANTNIGGENCHRGSAIGALLGAASVKKHPIPGRWKNGLKTKDLLAQY